MNKDIEVVYSEHTITRLDMANIPADTLNAIIKQNLSESISDFILENIDNLPIRYTVNHDSNMRNESYHHRIQFNIISDEELKRLKEIEYMYNGLCR